MLCPADALSYKQPTARTVRTPFVLTYHLTNKAVCQLKLKSGILHNTIKQLTSYYVLLTVSS